MDRRAVGTTAAEPSVYRTSPWSGRPDRVASAAPAIDRRPAAAYRGRRASGRASALRPRCSRWRPTARPRPARTPGQREQVLAAHIEGRAACGQRRRRAGPLLLRSAARTRCSGEIDLREPNLARQGDALEPQHDAVDSHGRLPRSPIGCSAGSRSRSVESETKHSRAAALRDRPPDIWRRQRVDDVAVAARRDAAPDRATFGGRAGRDRLETRSSAGRVSPSAPRARSRRIAIRWLPGGTSLGRLPARTAARSGRRLPFGPHKATRSCSIIARRT